MDCDNTGRSDTNSHPIPRIFVDTNESSTSNNEISDLELRNLVQINSPIHLSAPSSNRLRNQLSLSNPNVNDPPPYPGGPEEIRLWLNSVHDLTERSGRDLPPTYVESLNSSRKTTPNISRRNSETILDNQSRSQNWYNNQSWYNDLRAVRTDSSAHEINSANYGIRSWVPKICSSIIFFGFIVFLTLLIVFLYYNTRYANHSRHYHKG